MSLVKGNAQVTTTKDSLLTLLQAAKEDTNKVKLYLDIGEQYELTDIVTAKNYYQKAKSLSEKLDYTHGLIKSINSYTFLLNIDNKLDSSLLLNKQAIQLANKLNDPLLQGKCNVNTGNSFAYMNMYDSAIAYYEKGKIFIEKAGDANIAAQVGDIMQNAYVNLKRYSEAVQFGEASLRYFRKTGDTASLARVLVNLGNSYYRAGYISKASAAYRESLILARKADYKVIELRAMNDIGNMYLGEMNTDSLKFYFENALAIANQINSQEGKSVAERGLAFYSFFKKDYTTAKLHIENALTISKENDLPLENSENLAAMSSILFAMQDIDQGEKYLRMANSLEDSLTGNDVRDKTLLLEKLYETEKKETQIKFQQAELRQKTNLNYFLMLGAAALLVIILLGYRNYRSRQKLQQTKIDELETEKQLTATEAVLIGEEQERTRLAKDLHDGLGGMLSGIKYSLSNMKENLIMTPGNAQVFERSIDMLDSSIKEMRRVAHNMMPEMLIKYGLNIALQEYCAEINNSGVVQVNYQPIGMEGANFEQTAALTIYRIVQELVNNTIKHAAAQNILVQPHVSDENKFLSLTVEDDGNGFDTTLLKDAKGIGWTNIQNRVEFLKGTIDIKSSLGNGTSILIEINI